PTCPPACLSNPLTTIFTCFSTEIWIPDGIGNRTGCEYPRESTTSFPSTCALYPHPWLSSSFVTPVVTPATAFATRLRTRPWRAFSRLLSRPLSTMTEPSSTRTAIPCGIATLSLPFGPSIATAASATETLTPLAIVTGFLPIRDIVVSADSQVLLPDRTYDL